MSELQRFMDNLAGNVWTLPMALAIGVLLWLLLGHLRKMGTFGRDPVAVAFGTLLRAFAFWVPVSLGLRLALSHYDKGEQSIQFIDQGIKVVFLAAMSLAAAQAIKRGYKVAQERFSDMQPVERNRALVIRKLLTAAVFVLGTFMVLAAVNVDIGPLLAGGAISGIVVGLALQESLSSVFSGLFLTWDASIRIGDFVRFPTGQEGTIESIGWRNTHVRLVDKNLLLVPNGEMAKTIVVNMSRPSTETAVTVPGSVAYGSDLNKVEIVAMDTAVRIQQAYAHTVQLPVPTVRWQAMGESSLEYRIIMPIADQSDMFAARSDLMKAVYESFTLEGIEIPLPQRVVLLRGAEGKVTET